MFPYKVKHLTSQIHIDSLHIIMTLCS